MSHENAIEVAVTGHLWMSPAATSIEAALERLIKTCEKELLITAYSIGGKGQHIIGLIENALQAGRHVELVVNRLREQQPYQVVQKLLTLVEKYPTFSLYDFTPGNIEDQLHAKLFMADRRRLLIGSANISGQGLVHNHELAIIVTGPDVVQVAEAFDRLTGSLARING